MITNCVERTKEIGKKCNLPLFTPQQLLSALYARLSMKLAPSGSCHIDYQWVLGRQILVTRGGLGVAELTWDVLGAVYLSAMLINTTWGMNNPRFFGEIISSDSPLILFLLPLMAPPSRLTRGQYPKTWLWHSGRSSPSRRPVLYQYEYRSCVLVIILTNYINFHLNIHLISYLGEDCHGIFERKVPNI